MSRKYRQRGYRDEERPERPRRRGGPREDTEGPRGRGLGKPTATVFRCARCGRELDAAAALAVDGACAQCGADLHTCTHCRHFDTSARFQCRETIPAAIASKATANDCGLFEPRLAQELDAGHPRTDDARAAFDDLFDF